MSTSVFHFSEPLRLLLKYFCNNCITSGSSPDENTLAVVSLPQTAVTLVGHSKDMRRQLPHLVFTVDVDCGAAVQAGYPLIGIYCSQDRADVGLREIIKKTQVEGDKRKWERKIQIISEPWQNIHTWRKKQSKLQLLLLVHLHEVYIIITVDVTQCPEPVTILNYCIYGPVCTEAGGVLESFAWLG